MNRLTIIGNLTKDPELRTTQAGVQVCTFTVAVNRKLTAQQRQNGQQAEADYFRVTAWRELGVNCGKFLQKGKKVCVIGAVSVSMYTGNDGVTRATLEVQAVEVEFLSPRVSDPEGAQYEQTAPAPAPQVDAQSGYEQVDTDELPF